MCSLLPYYYNWIYLFTTVLYYLMVRNSLSFALLSSFSLFFRVLSLLLHDVCAGIEILPSLGSYCHDCKRMRRFVRAANFYECGREPKLPASKWAPLFIRFFPHSKTKIWYKTHILIDSLKADALIETLVVKKDQLLSKISNVENRLWIYKDGNWLGI